MIDIVISYLIGSLPTAYLIGRFKGIDLHQYGSGNIGATNAWRVLGKTSGIATLVIDIAKGLIAVKLIPLLFSATGDNIHRFYCGLGAILGHNFPIYLKFRGGKGVATTVGVLLGVTPELLGVLVIFWLIVAVGSGYVSLGSITAALSLPIFAFFMKYPPETIWFSAILALLVVIQHRANLKRLLAGEEKRFFRKK